MYCLFSVLACLLKICNFKNVGINKNKKNYLNKIVDMASVRTITEAKREHIWLRLLYNRSQKIIVFSQVKPLYGCGFV